ncbi:MAG: hypothetical protein A2033_02150 [Bacteroidetes bacterium GWA2_31_9]|nr:MAG: hypothetical protein A2033_02150 [Bacteroidetes bacterium GWA2_31_9]
MYLENQNLTNAQLELLKLFSTNFNDLELKELKHLLANFYAKKAIESANNDWKKKGLTDNDMDNLLK